MLRNAIESLGHQKFTLISLFYCYDKPAQIDEQV